MAVRTASGTTDRTAVSRDMGASASKPEPVTRTVEEKYEVRTVQARAPHVFVTTARACAARRAPQRDGERPG